MKTGFLNNPSQAFLYFSSFISLYSLWVYCYVSSNLFGNYKTLKGIFNGKIIIYLNKIHKRINLKQINIWLLMVKWHLSNAMHKQSHQFKKNQNVNGRFYLNKINSFASINFTTKTDIIQNEKIFHQNCVPWLHDKRNVSCLRFVSHLRSELMV